MNTKLFFHQAVAIFIFVHCTLSSFAQINFQDGLKVLNPDQGNWTKVAGKFESIHVTVTPSGCYTNYDIVFEISAQNTNLANSMDSLEAEYKFSLPTGAILHNAVLWMNNIPVKAEIYERNKAKFIYEGLVSRKIDPLIIYQNEKNSYEARIFPIINPANRKIQISYLVPNNITSSGIEVPMDLRMFRSDLNGWTPNINFKIANNTFLGTPYFIGNIQAVTAGNYDEFTLQATTSNLFLNNAIYFSLPINNNFFISQPQTPNEGFYQYMLMPATSASIAKNVYVLDYRTVNYINYNTIMQMVKNKIKFSLSDNDSFNVVYVYNGVVTKLANNWIQADDTSINNAFATLPANLVSSGSLFFQATCDAISFINNHGSDGKILMISNAGSANNSVGFLNQLINTTKSLMNNNYPISVFDFNDQFLNPLWNGTEYFYNNEYYYYNLSAVTGGSYFNLRNNTYNYYYNATSSFVDNFSRAITSLKKLHNYDAVAIIGNSLLHSDYKLKNKVVIPLGEAYMETGKYVNTPTSMQFNYYYGIDSLNYVDNFYINNTMAADTFTKKIWGSNFVEDLINNNGMGQYTSAIINNSMQYDVLCEYTALLALEPDTAGTITNEFPTGNEDISKEENSDIKAFPNPFTKIQYLEVAIPKSLQNKDWELKVYNALGQLVKRETGNTNFSDKLKINWYSENTETLTQGMYFIHIKIGNYTRTVKVLKN